MTTLFFILAVVVAATGTADTLDGQYIFPLQDKHVHGSTIIETPGGDLIAAWFYGSGERTENDVQIQGARLRKGTAQWSEVFSMADTPEFPDCNPVLFVDAQKRLWLFWSVVLANRWENCLIKYRRADRYDGDGPPEWNWQDVIQLRPDDAFPEQVAAAFKEINPSEEMWASYALPYSEMVIEASRDKLKRQIGWMTRNHPLTLPSGRILLPLYSDGFNLCLMACSDDQGSTWYPSKPIAGLGPIQPTLAQRKEGTLTAFFRDSGDFPKRIQRAESPDEGVTWTITQDTDIPNPSSSLEVRALADGRWILICNDLEDGRNRLGVFLSEDEGKSWATRRYLEDDADPANAYAYPSIIQAADGRLHATYSFHTHEGKTIKHVSFSPDWITASVQEANAPADVTAPVPAPVAPEAMLADSTPAAPAAPTAPAEPVPAAPAAPDVPAEPVPAPPAAPDVPAEPIPAPPAAPDVPAEPIPAPPTAPDVPAEPVPAPPAAPATPPADTKAATIPAATSPESTPDGQALLATTAAQLAACESLGFDFTAKFTYTRKNVPQDAFMEGSVILGNGNQGMLHVKRADSDTNTYNNAKGRIAYAPGLKRYSPLPVVATRRELVATMTSGTLEVALEWLADMIDGKAATFDTVSAISGERGGTPCWDIQAEAPAYLLKTSLSKSEPHTILALEIDFKEPSITKYKFPEDASLVIKMEFSNWKLNFSPPDSTFEFSIPPDATQTGLEDLSSKPKIEEGQPAPDFSLEKLGGGMVNLKDHIGKDIILLEFWHTHCTVCQDVTPLIIEMAKKFEGKSVAIFAVNLRETPEQIQSFIKEEHPAATILLDKNSQVGGLYQATGVPKLVLIGKDGLIKAVFKGKPANLMEQLTSRIEDLLQGKSEQPAAVSMIVEGAPAPDFSLEQLGGGKIQLADHFGKDVIVLGFWATFCGFCRKAMPLFEEVRNDFSGQEAVFYTVNEREAPEKIQPYIQEQKLSFPILLDTDAKVGALYEVKGIPKIVVIGKDGLIKAVNKGLPSNLTELLTSQVQKALQ